MIGNRLASLDECLVIGNGESRLDLNLTNILTTITSIGCNAIYRDHQVDHLVCVDRRMVKEAKQRHPNIYTRKDWSQHFNVGTVPDLPYTGVKRQDDPWHWGSGPYSVLLGATLFKQIHMIGFDLYSKSSTVNNVYKNTANYSSSDQRAVDPSYWIYQISKVFETFPDKYFTVYNNNWIIPESWKMNNVSFKTLDKLPLIL